MRLVQHEQRRRRQQRAREREALALALRERSRGPLGLLARSAAASAVSASLGAEAVEPRAEDEVLARAQPAPEQRAVPRVGDAGALGRCQLAARVPVDEHLPARGRSRPAMQRSSVDLPLPFGPSRPSARPGASM